MAIRIASAEQEHKPVTATTVKRIKKVKETAPVVEPIQPSQEQETAPVEPPNGNKRKGFASMSGDRHKQISSKGGASLAKEKRHFARNPDAARKAGAKGGSISKRKAKTNDH
jgi:general stress protein YciG